MIMINRWLLILVLSATAITAFVGTGRAASNHALLSQPCRTPDSLTLEHLHFVRRIASSTSTDAARWRAPAIPFIADTAGLITIVSDSATCSRAIASFDTLAQLGDSGVTEIEVLRVDTVLVISHPALVPPGAEGAGRFVVDTAMHFLQAYLHD